LSDHEERIMAYLAGAAAEAGNDRPLTRDTELVEAGLLDSMGLVGLIRFLEDAFALDIPEDDLSPELFETPASIAAYVGRRLG
jgi:acyl carrier protein